MRDDVGVRLQLRLHPPLLGDVVEEHDQPVADPCDAMQERAEHVAVPEGRVVRHLVDERGARVADLDVRPEGPAVAHRGQRLEERVALGRLRRDPEAAHHRRVAVAEREVDDRPGGVADRPQEPDRLREALEQGAKALRTARAEDLDERRVLTPRLRLELVVRLVHARRIRALLPAGRHRLRPARFERATLPPQGSALSPELRVGEPMVPPRPPRRCARQDSNLRPLPPQGSALSPELRARGTVSVPRTPVSARHGLSWRATPVATPSSASAGTSRRTKARAITPCSGSGAALVTRPTTLPSSVSSAS